MTFEQLETFVQVARARSFSRAGIVLNLAQPTLSGRVAALESELGAALFHRRGHTVELTEAGRALMPYAERMLALRAEGRREAQRAVDGGIGSLLLGANPTCSQYLAPRLIERFWREHPTLRIWVRTALSPSLMESLLDGAIHLALCSRAQLDTRAQVLWSFEQPLLVVVSARTPARAPTLLPPRQISPNTPSSQRRPDRRISVSVTCCRPAPSATSRWRPPLVK